ncbi:MAG: penicillin-binding protein 2 [Deltaproteobacteria bacterium]|nr:penicillin-binding protein 2 [Deltaproteobacteria bacterium]
MLDFSQEGVEGLASKTIFGYLTLAVFFLFIFFRLGYLQLVRGDFFWMLASEHKLKEIRIPATRGVIRDRRQRVLVENRPSLDLTLVPQYVINRTALEKTLLQVTSLSKGQLDEAWQSARRLPPFYPSKILSDIPYSLAARLKVAKVTAMGEEDGSDLRGIEIIRRPLRRYPLGRTASSLMGYLGEVSPSDLERLRKKQPERYWPGDLVGVSGIEKKRESVLKGEDGYEIRVVDAMGREINTPDVAYLLKKKEPLPGFHLTLTLDRDLQLVAEEQFEGKAGSLVALDPATGEILAWVSLPSYKPDELTANIRPEFWQSLVADPRKLFLNRVLQAYPPGSTFKIVTAVAALEEKVIEPTEKINCAGGLHFGGRFFHCWREGGHGLVDIRRALAESCDTYFYQIGLRLGVDRLAKYASLLGLGDQTGIGLEEEKKGLIPTEAWKKKVFGQPWLAGETLSVSVGQGAVLVTPLQSALLIASIVNGGYRVKPTLELKPDPKSASEKIPISDKTLSLVREGLADVVASPAGTAHGIRSNLVSIGGKTGTAQVISEEGRQRAGGGEEFRDHAWFIAFAPAEAPKIAVAVLVEHGGFGASAAAPIAKKIIEKHFEILNPK